MIISGGIKIAEEKPKEDPLKKFVLEKMVEPYRKGSDWGPEETKRVISANNETHQLHPGVVCIQCGRGAGYGFDLVQEGAQEHYEKMLDQAKRGLLQSTVPGKFDRHTVSGIADSLAYIITHFDSPSYYS